MVYFVWFLAGVVFGTIVTCIIKNAKHMGTLRFYDDEPGEPPVLTAELHEPVEVIRKCKYVRFDVSPK